MYGHEIATQRLKTQGWRMVPRKILVGSGKRFDQSRSLVFAWLASEQQTHFHSSLLEK